MSTRCIGKPELVLRFSDDGHGMDAPSVKAFFSLAMTTRMKKDERGFKARALMPLLPAPPPEGASTA
jgi:hypothetical protein